MKKTAFSQGLLAVAALVASQPAQAQLTWPGCANLVAADFKKTTLLSYSQDAALVEPLRIDIDNAGRIYVALKRSGTLLRLDPADNNKKTVLGQVPVTGGGFQGFLGMVLSPDFDKSGYVFLLTNHRANSSAPILFRVSRVTVTGSALVSGSQKTVLEWPTDLTEGHTGGDMEFGPDGSLYVSTGNDTWARPDQVLNPKYTYKLTGSDDYRTPIDEREKQFNALRSSSNTNDLRGKIIRILPVDFPASQAQWGINVTYTVPEGNLFPLNKAGTRPEIYAMGLRNPFTIHVGKNGLLYIADVGPQGSNDVTTGPSGGDQLYITSKPANFGHPMFVHGNKPYPIYDYAQEKVTGQFDPKLPINFSVFNTGLDTLPPPVAASAVSHWRASLNTADWFDAQAMSLMSGPVYAYDGSNPSKVKFPPHFDGKWLIGEEQQNLMKVATLNGGTVTKVEDIFGNMTFYNPLDMEFAPDGSLVLIEYSGWNTSNANTKISRITYAGTCLPTSPTALRPQGREGSYAPGQALVHGGLLRIPASATKVDLFNMQGKRIWTRVLRGNETELRVPGHLQADLGIAKYGY